MKLRFRDSMNWLHTWSCVVLGCLLFAVFLTGTLAYFQYEITHWMQPEVEQIQHKDKAINQAQAYLNTHTENAPRWTIVPPNERFSPIVAYWRDKNTTGRFSVARLDEQGNEINSRATRGGEFLYRFHFDLHYMPVFYARWLVGIAAMLMLVGIITGIVVHKKIFKDFFTLQFNKGAKSWLNSHTVCSVLALPFHIMITYTGIVTLMLMYFSWAMNMGDGDRRSFFSAFSDQAPALKASGEKAQLLPLGDIYNSAKAQLGHAGIGSIIVSNPGDSNAMVEVYENATEELTSDYRTLRYHGVTGELLHDSGVTNAAEQTRRTMISLHAGRFADTSLRWLYFLSGIMGTAMVGTGLLLWSNKRKQKMNPRFRIGYKIMDVTNLASIIGLPLAISGYFAANRLLPLQLESRAEWEIHCFFIVWLMAFVYPILRGCKHSWQELSFITGVSYLALPVISIFTTSRHILNYQFERDATLLFMDLLLFFTGGLFIYIAHIVWRKGHEPAVTARPKRPPRGVVQ
ncbi:PepSY-associated TM helix domain-containing protein [Pseudoalteromonas mariniglutinosa]